MPCVRPTLRCLRDDLKIPVPPNTTPLDEIDHPVITKANEQFSGPDGSHERIAAVDDQILFKVKVGRWRGAVWRETDLGWLVAAGKREDGSADDFYDALKTQASAARSRYNTANSGALKTKTYTTDWLPNMDDRERYHAEESTRFDRHLKATVHNLLSASLRDGCEHRAKLGAFSIGVQVRADDGHETGVAIRITGSVPEDITSVIFDLIPGCDRSMWQYQRQMPDRDADPGEDIWFNIMDPAAAANLLDNEPYEAVEP